MEKQKNFLRMNRKKKNKKLQKQQTSQKTILMPLKKKPLTYILRIIMWEKTLDNTVNCFDNTFEHNSTAQAMENSEKS